MTIDTRVTLKDAAGRELGQQTVSIVHNQRLILEPTSRRCNYGRACCTNPLMRMCKYVSCAHRDRILRNRQPLPANSLPWMPRSCRTIFRPSMACLPPTFFSWKAIRSDSDIDALAILPHSTLCHRDQRHRAGFGRRPASAWPVHLIISIASAAR
jgi:hypothetical protein